MFKQLNFIEGLTTNTLYQFAFEMYVDYVGRAIMRVLYRKVS